MTLKDQAIEVMKNAYAPYSQYQVGAAIQLSNGKVYAGCNVENASFGASVCAERVAIWKAVSEEGPKISITHVTVATHSSPPAAPCGLCRQVINEFASPNCTIELVNLKNEVSNFLHQELLPHNFGPEDLLTSSEI